MDLNGDGYEDMISGSYNPGDMYLFAGKGDASFEAGKILKGRDGKNLGVGRASAVFAADWDQDGDLDLIVGNINGEVYWIANAGKSKVPAFASPVPIAVDGKALVVEKDAGPCIADWDGDGQLDLLVSEDNGAIIFFRNLALEGVPKLAAGVTLVPKGRMNSLTVRRGIRSKLCVVDWNEDGRLDLLVGDYCRTAGKQPEWTDAQRVEKDAALALWMEIMVKREALEEQSRQKFRLEHGLSTDQKLSPQQAQELQKMIAALYKTDKRYLALEKEFKSQEEYMVKKKYIVHDVTHGHVWAFLRQPSDTGIMEADAERSEQ